MSVHIDPRDVPKFHGEARQQIEAAMAETPEPRAKTQRRRRSKWSPVLWQVIFLVLAVDLGLWLAMMLVGK